MRSEPIDSVTGLNSATTECVLRHFHNRNARFSAFQQLFNKGTAFPRVPLEMTLAVIHRPALRVPRGVGLVT